MSGSLPTPGSPADMLFRLKAVLPTRWFADETPVLDAVLSGFAATAAALYGLLAGVRAQARVATASGAFLDMIAADYFGPRLQRRFGQGDAAWRSRILAEMRRDRATRTALVSMLTDLTGRTPVVFEPARPADTGAWNLVNGYGVAGGWGSLLLPYQVFVTAYRPLGVGIATVSGWGSGAGGYGAGAIEYAGAAMLAGQVTDADIAASAAGVMPAASIAWLKITN